MQLADPNPCTTAPGSNPPPAAVCAEWLFDRYYDRICSLAMSLLENEEAARQTTLDVLSAAVTVAERGQAGIPPFLWLYRSAIRACVGAAGRAAFAWGDPTDACLPAFSDEGRHALPVDDWTATSERIPHPLVSDAVRRFIGELPHPGRIAVILVDVQGLTVDEVGRILDLPPATVIARLHRARLCLREKLSGFSLAASGAG
jgi:RNA polymerase sigma-70 factor (ECF subfamily)